MKNVAVPYNVRAGMLKARKRNPDSERNITRVDKNSSTSGGSTHGFQVRFMRGEHKYNKFFSDSKYGGIEGARAHAREYRDLAEKHVPEIKPISERKNLRASHKLNSNNKSGVIGIHFQEKRNANGTITKYVVAVASPAPLKQLKKGFRIGNRPIPEVIEEATLWRNQILEERLRKEGADKQAWRNALDELIAKGQKHLQRGERIRVFLCHSKGDKDYVKSLYNRLLALGCDPWLDEEKLLPGQEWEKEIPLAIKNSHVFVVCLSADSVTKRGFVQKEIKMALDVAEEIPEGDIFIIPIKIQPCDAPDMLRKYQWLEAYRTGYSKLIASLAKQAKKLSLLPLRTD